MADFEQADKIIRAVYRHDYAELDELLSTGNVNSPDEDGRTPLMHAVLAGDADIEMVEYLIDRGADVNVHEQRQEWTALHFAAREQRLDIVRMLLDAGAVVDAIDCFGNTPLSRCLNVMPPNVEVIKVLLSRGADPFYENNYGSSPVNLAKLMEHQELLSVLCKGENR